MTGSNKPCAGCLNQTRSFTGAGRAAALRRWSAPRSNGSTGSAPAASSSRSVNSRRLRQRSINRPARRVRHGRVGLKPNSLRDVIVWLGTLDRPVLPQAGALRRAKSAALAAADQLEELKPCVTEAVSEGRGARPADRGERRAGNDRFSIGVETASAPANDGSPPSVTSPSAGNRDASVRSLGQRRFQAGRERVRQLRAQADRGDVEERVAVDRGEVDPPTVPPQDHLGGLGRVRRYPERAGKIVGGTGGQDPERQAEASHAFRPSATPNCPSEIALLNNRRSATKGWTKGVSTNGQLRLGSNHDQERGLQVYHSPAIRPLCHGGAMSRGRPGPSWQDGGLMTSAVHQINHLLSLRRIDRALRLAAIGQSSS
jgi:hypothetical protein